MPLAIGQLRSLQTLPFFNIGEEAGRQIGQLRSLNNLSGSLEIRNLELVRSKEEAESANLFKKQNINELRLLWNELDNLRENDREYNQLLEGLHPHQNLKGLIIERFFGDQLSTWIGQLKKLVKFELRNCRTCKELPTLGHMPFLKYLHLEGLDNITTIGPSFYGESTVHSGSSSKLFPTLEHLILENMLNLREWVEASDHDGAMEVFPVLNTMRIKRPSLSFLDIPYCKKLTDLPKGKLCSLTSFRSLEIGPFSETTELRSFLDLFDALPQPMHPYLPFIWKLSLVGWPHWESLPDQLQYLSALTYLELDGFGVKSLPDWFGKLSSLELLYLYNCKKLENLPSDQTMRSLTRLRELQIEMCPLLMERCNSESSSSSSTNPVSEWSKISHIPRIIINGQRIRG
ncbi:putative disease resistance RPP13-like protein 1 [Coffea eugenioides]|uniref:putative disease resistance RPP13-like protein 1 n=1 Tax=Coffea eugenioides TaxID=49369 RepID=UPI000F60E6A1|nr:putative disease resistance RPP13-like protein 1 [Coffea eugenioides]